MKGFFAVTVTPPRSFACSLITSTGTFIVALEEEIFKWCTYNLSITYIAY